MHLCRGYMSHAYHYWSLYQSLWTFPLANLCPPCWRQTRGILEASWPATGVWYAACHGFSCVPPLISRNYNIRRKRWTGSGHTPLEPVLKHNRSAAIDLFNTSWMSRGWSKIADGQVAIFWNTRRAFPEQIKRSFVKGDWCGTWHPTLQRREQLWMLFFDRFPAGPVHHVLPRSCFLQPLSGCKRPQQSCGKTTWASRTQLSVGFWLNRQMFSASLLSTHKHHEPARQPCCTSVRD